MSAIDLQRAGQPLLVETFAEWREAARELLVHDVPPELVTWSTPYAGDLFSGAPPTAEQPHNPSDLPPAASDRANDGAKRGPKHGAPSIPRSLMDMLQSAACCRVPDRWAFLYRVIWR